ncbi:hydrogenase expression protein HupH [Aeromicrobium sp. SMF47]|uniref:aspartate/glutamate racemase family protein n=1 Tax=Aeromicrobium TaxID=2040 RepID=UPI00129E1B7E|nr:MULTISPECIES: aspartate/glutamate racemase family protein [Aeromicrobium]MRJ75794.1 hydrogenase expression protein HupH [Aeromicrobium yanjiei]MRK00137.1 hydrogenase expression protein HupH [Aeromicrobium sp. S22]
MKILYILPVPVDAEGVEKRREQALKAQLKDTTEIVCRPVSSSCDMLDSYFKDILHDYGVIVEGMHAEEEGFDAVVMDTVSDAGLFHLRSRLNIPVIGPGSAAYAFAGMLGRKFSVITMWDKWAYLYEKGATNYGIKDKLASVRSLGMTPDLNNLLDGKLEETAANIVEQARLAAEEDGADVVLLGSTTMHESASLAQPNSPIPLIDPGPLALRVAETVVDLGLTHSKRAWPSPVDNRDDRKFVGLPL